MSRGPRALPHRAPEGNAMSPTLISVQVGVPRRVLLDGGEVSTGIFKTPVHERILMRPLNLDGDRQADLTVHGGRDKAVYAYPSEHYAYWKKELPGVDLPWGSFGENLTTQRLLESEVFLGDRYAIGGAEVAVTQPRIPCYKLNLKFERGDMAKRFPRKPPQRILFPRPPRRRNRRGRRNRPRASGRKPGFRFRCLKSLSRRSRFGNPARARAPREIPFQFLARRTQPAGLIERTRNQKAATAFSLPQGTRKRTMREPQFQKQFGLAASMNAKQSHKSVAKKVSKKVSRRAK